MLNQIGNVNDNSLDDELSGLTQRANFFKFAQGKTVFKILPPHKDANGKWFRIVKRHNLFFGEGKTPGRLGRAINCREESCDICAFGYEVFNEAKTSDDQVRLKFADKVRPREEVYINAVVFAAPVEFKVGTVYLIRFPKREFKQILGWDRDEQLGWDDVTGARNYFKGNGLTGVKFTVSRSGSTLENTRYELTPNPRREDLVKELTALGVDVGTLEIPNLYDPNGPLGGVDNDYFNDTLDSLKKEFQRATQVFDGGSVKLDFQDSLRAPQTAMSAAGPLMTDSVLSDTPLHTTISVPSPFRTKV